MEDLVFNKAVDIVRKAKNNGVFVFLEGGKVKVRIDKDKVIEDDLIEEIKKYRDEIKAVLDNEGYGEIPRRKKGAKSPLSAGQEYLWVIDRLGGSVQYHLSATLRVDGDIDRDALSYAFRGILDRHEVLRTVIREEDNDVFQYVIDSRKWQIAIIDGHLYRNDHPRLQSLVKDIVAERFDLSADYMLRVHLIELSAIDHILVVTMHHIAADAWSMPIIIRELAELYSAFQANRQPVLPPLPIQYADYAAWERDSLTGSLLEKQLQYWKQRLNGVMPLNLPTDLPYPAIPDIAGGEVTRNIEERLAGQLTVLSRQQDATLYMTLLSVFNILLYRYSGMEDICIGSSIAARRRQETEGLVGYFVNALALRNQVQGTMRFKELLAQVKQTMLDAFDHQEAPFGKVVEVLGVERDRARNPVFQVMFVFENTAGGDRLGLGGVSLSVAGVGLITSKFDITLSVASSPEGIRLNFTYRTDLYLPATIERMADHYIRLLHEAAARPESCVETFEMLSTTEREQLLVSLNSMSVPIPKGRTVAALWQEQAARTPDHVAVIFQEDQLTYEELDNRSGRLAGYLLQRGVKTGSLVPVCMDRGLDMVTALLAILKAGGAYVPVDPDVPPERVAHMLSDTGAGIVICDDAGRPALRDWPGDRVVHPGIGQWTTGSAEKVVWPGDLTENHPAYVIYTSGSTGLPKGVIITNRNLIDYVYGLRANTTIGDCGSFALVSTIAADLGNTVLFPSLLSGSTLHLLPRELVNDAERIRHYFGKHAIECVKIVPSHWKALCTEEQLLLPAKLLIFGGEALPVSYLEEIRRSGAGCAVINHYGPTETTVGKLLHVVEPGRSYAGPSVPIGKPFSNTSVYVLDKRLGLCPVGVPGELYIAGEGLARGYLNNDGLTAERFVPQPWNTGERMYRTGDIVKWMPDGDIQYIGRNDDQVKIRGYRVELREIESALRGDDSVRQAAVVARADTNGNKRLVAYVVTDGRADRERLLAGLKNRLPDYMIPAAVVQLDELPLTANGKIDRGALPDDENRPVKEPRGPANQVEAVLVKIWQDLLEVSDISTEDNFFDLGGHSLLAIRAVSAIRKTMSLEVTIGDIFNYPSIAMLAGRLLRQEPPEGHVQPLLRVNERPDLVPLSFGQERLWLIDQLEGSVAYHIPAVFRLRGPLDRAALGYAFQELVNRHEVLRTVFEQTDGKVWQRQLDRDTWKMGAIDKDEYRRDADALQKVIADLVNTPFDLASDHKIRVDLVVLGEEEYVLIVVLHHIASDGWSVPILVNELVNLYNDRLEGKPSRLPLLPVQYADFSLWQRGYLQGEVLEEKLRFWKQLLEGVEPLNLPTDYERPPFQSSKGASRRYHLHRALTARLHQLSRDHGTTLFMTLLAVYKVLLFRYTGQTDICVGSAVVNRDPGDVEGLIGFFANTLALRSDLVGDPTFAELLDRVRNVSLQAYAHQDVPFEKIVESVVKERNLNRSPLFQVMFDLQHAQRASSGQLSGLELSPEGFRQTTSKFDISLTVTEQEYGLQVGVEYCSDLYREGTIDRMMGHYEQLLMAVTEDTSTRISQLQLLTREEEHQLLEEFNRPQVLREEKPLMALIEEQAELHAGDTAIVAGGHRLTYRELNEKANRLGHYLRRKGVGDGWLVPVCVDRSADMIVALLGILKAGAAYVPLDPLYPEDRMRYILNDVDAAIVVTNARGRSGLPAGMTTELVDLADDEEVIGRESGTNPGHYAGSGSLAYIIYTSGSTGVPKGVMIGHGSLMNYLLNGATRYIRDDRPGNGVFIHLPYTFDASVTELFMPLLHGRPMIIGEKGGAEVFSRLFYSDSVVGEEHDFLKLTPSHMELLAAAIAEAGGARPAARLVLGGEALRPAHLRYWIDSGMDIEIINEYGPTEATVGATTYSIMTGSVRNKSGYTIPIGKPMENVQIHILDSAGGLVPIGVAGEVYIAGAGLARGYLNRPDLTAQRFVLNPFDKRQGSRLYRSGDLARWLPDGEIEYLGRNDEQVKIRGYRIEPGEIEYALRQCVAVRRAVVLASAKDHDCRLVAYIVPDGNFDKQDAISALRRRLPDHMIPAQLVAVDHIPLTANGKIDRRRLEEQHPAFPADNSGAPRTQLEIVLASIWEKALDADRVGIKDSFFELGGHSLLAVRIITDIQKRLNVKLPLNALFQYPDIASLAAFIEQSPGRQEGPGSAIPSGNAQEMVEKTELGGFTYYAVTNTQKYWADENIDREYKAREKEHGNVYLSYSVAGDLDVAAFKKAVALVVGRHESLRATFHLLDGEYRMRVNTDREGLYGNFVEFLDLSDDYRAGIVSEEELARFRGHQFVLDRGPLMLVRIFLLEHRRYAIAIKLHHIIDDTWSDEILINELLLSYKCFVKNEQPDLEPLPLQLKEILAMTNRDTKANYASQKEYWKGLYPGLPGELKMPWADKRAGRRTTPGPRGRIAIAFKDEARQQLMELAKSFSVPLFVVLQATFKTFISGRTGQKDMLIGTYVSGRDHPETRHQIGCYARTVLIRTVFDPEDRFSDAVLRVKKANEDMANYRAYPLKTAMEELPDWESNWTDFWKINLLYSDKRRGYYTGAEDYRQLLSGLDIRFSPIESREDLLMPIDMMVEYKDLDDRLLFVLNYDNSLYTEPAIHDFTAGYFEHVDKVSANIYSTF